MNKTRTSPQAKGLAIYQENKREKMRARIDETIHKMREEQIPITKKALAEELGITEKALYAPYIKEQLLNFKEFNPALEDTESQTEDSDSLREENKLLKLKNRELSVKNKELVEDLRRRKSEYAALEQRYERLLGAYQDSLASKIIPI